MAHDRYQKQSLGVLYQKIKESRVLLVGAGGIGCELLKNLVLSGYGEIHIIDLDTIDLSNLNRQFLFRQEHIKKPKAIVAKEVAQKFNPEVKLEAHHANIKDAHFNVEWFSSFDLVFNALDNLEARRHVNRMCLVADTPLIESGTTGFNGQVQVIKRGKTACYDCSEKTVPKSFPVCTIRSTPSQPIHCIVWAKSYLLPELFGVSEVDSSEVDASADAENAEEVAKLKEEAEALKKIREAMGSEDFVKQVFDKVFKEDIARLAKMEDMWKSRKAPEPLDHDTIAQDAATIDQSIVAVDQRTWTREEAFFVFRDSLARLAHRTQEESAAAEAAGQPRPIITFDKDDDDTLDFVTASAIIRSNIFAIEAKSKFDTKQMAGNIIPAIATTNAMIAGLCVMQAFKVMKGDYGRTKMIFLDKGNIAAGASDAPNLQCVVCGVMTARLAIDPETATVQDLVKDVLQGQLGYGEEISVLNDQGGILFDPDSEDNLSKKLSELDLKESSFLIIKDDDDEPKVDLHLLIEHKPAEDGAKAVALVQKDNEKLEVPKRPPKTPIDEHTPDESEIVEANGTATANTIGKRKREMTDDGDDDGGSSTSPVKKVQQESIAEQKTNGNKTLATEPIVLDEEEGAIELD